MTWMIYGAYGYTGELCAAEALRRGEQPILAGRRPVPTAAVAATHDLPHRAFPLDDPTALDAGLKGVDLVLHCAGPFSATSAPMVAACARAGAHYLDITGEIGVFEAIHGQGERWAKAGIVAMPGVGFDVVPTDCLAVELKRLVPSAVALELAFYSLGAGPSQGTSKTMIESLGLPSKIRRGGQIIDSRAGSLTRRVDFGERQAQVACIAWGDVSTAWHSTGIDDITVYMALPERAISGMKWTARLGGLLQSAPVQRFLRWRVDRSVEGPDPSRRASSRTLIWGEVTAKDGEKTALLLGCPNGYTLTAEAGVDIALRVLAGDVPPGAHTPAGAFGPDLVLAYAGVTRSEPTHS